MLEEVKIQLRLLKAASSTTGRYRDRTVEISKPRETSDGEEASGQLRLLQPLAATLRTFVPERAEDDGLFGPRSLVWRLHRDRSFLLAGVRSLLMQALHPLAMAGVAQHSSWRQDPFGRIASTSGYILTTTYGSTGAANAAAARVRAIHKHVHGIDDVTGLPYRADDPALLLWVHVAMVESIVTIVRAYGRALDAPEADRYVAEMVPFAVIVGVPVEQVPTTVAGLHDFIGSVALLRATPAALDAMAVVLDPPELDADLRDLWRDLGQVAVGTLPDWAREMYGYAMPSAELLERESVRQLLGVLDFAFESQPGVIEARRRIELRMRA
jgi:uncharacterized protein (DUF2236 family)